MTKVSLTLEKSGSPDDEKASYQQMPNTQDAR